MTEEFLKYTNINEELEISVNSNTTLILGQSILENFEEVLNEMKNKNQIEKIIFSKTQI
jgi:beta-N-acetylglucosaminidase